jgi:hypothetical protein
MSELKHGIITTHKITETIWVAKTVTHEIMKAEIEIKGSSEYNAFYKLMNFMESNETPKDVQTLDNGNKIYKF